MIDRLVSKFGEIKALLDHPVHRDRRLRGFLCYLRWNIGRRLLNDAHYSIELRPGTQIILSNQENYATLAYTCRLYDFDEMQFMLHYLKPGDVFGDFGSNVGVYSVLAGSAGATVLAVEPVPDTHARLQRNLRLNDVRGKALCCGLSDAAATLKFTSRLGGMNRVATSHDAETIEVEVMSPDALVAATGLQPVMLKIDVEGFELPLLRGASQLLEHVVAIIIELNGSGARYGRTDDDVHLLLKNAGFDCFDYASDRRELHLRNDFRRDAFNSLYIKRALIDAVQLRIGHSATADAASLH